MMLVAVVCLLFFLIVVGSIVYTTWRMGISPMPSTHKATVAMWALLPESIEGAIYDLGSGWGTLLFPFAKRYPTNIIKGYECSLLPYLFSKVWKWWISADCVEIYRRDFYEESLDDASVVVCYLFPGAMHRLKEKWEKELDRPLIVISNTFAIPGKIPLKVVDLDDFYRTKVYLYQFDSKLEKK